MERSSDSAYLLYSYSNININVILIGVLESD